MISKQEILVLSFFFWPHCIVRTVINFSQFLMSNIQVHTQVKIVADAQLGAGATEARELEANWVILDRSDYKHFVS